MYNRRSDDLYGLKPEYDTAEAVREKHGQTTVRQQDSHGG